MPGLSEKSGTPTMTSPSDTSEVTVLPEDGTDGPATVICTKVAEEGSAVSHPAQL
ncbi:hypothetical protein HCN51_50025 [Nonomuraea sp. FMUSA5-5]|uniref:Uncharacterized protein n=1 Tax=Nonomuraea composti TaxID=2720023 RepID=A0ABX1BQD9_9ACTN|nr:hypothetical protein [Nonomuraea sp. FMUSA5-5]NJP97476.1 hypothetical protein [Nonomuraea sp. FMUSA5-5]